MTDLADTASSRALPRRARSSRGAWTILTIFAVGGAVLAGLFLWPRRPPNPAPAGVAFGVPDGGVRVVILDARGGPAGASPVGEAVALAGREADVVGLIGFSSDQVMAVASGLGMQPSYDPRLHQHPKPDGGAAGATELALLSRLPLYEATPVRASRRRTVGASAVAVAGGRKFMVGTVLAGGGTMPEAWGKAWTEAGRPPAVVVVAVPPGGGTPAVPYGRTVAAEEAGSALLLSEHWDAVGPVDYSGVGVVSARWLRVGARRDRTPSP